MADACQLYVPSPKGCIDNTNNQTSHIAAARAPRREIAHLISAMRPTFHWNVALNYFSRFQAPASAVSNVAQGSFLRLTRLL